jgi:capsule polysaccharide export protein KpsE/RkpR
MPTITIDLTNAQAKRLADAMEEVTGLPTTVESVKQHLIRELKSIVARGEKQKADRLAAAPASFDIV